MHHLWYDDANVVAFILLCGLCYAFCVLALSAAGIIPRQCQRLERLQARKER